MDIGKQLGDARKKAGLTPEDLFKQTRIPVQTIQKIEANQADDLAKPYYTAFVRTLAKELGCDAFSMVQEIQNKDQTDDFEDELTEEKGDSNLWPAIVSLFEKNKSWLPVGIAALLILGLAGVYLKYGKTLFTDPEVPGQNAASKSGADSRDTGFLFYAVGLDKSVLHASVDSSAKERIELQANEKYSWKPQDSLRLELERPMAVGLYLEHEPLPFHIEDSAAVLNMLITETGIENLREVKRPLPVKPAPAVKKQKEAPEPVTLLGHLDPGQLIRKCPLIAASKQNYYPDSHVIQQIRQYNPSMSLLFFIGTWDKNSQILAGRTLSLLDQLNLTDIAISFIGVDESLKDRAGLVDFHRVQGVPTLLFLSRGNELGRVAGEAGQGIETRFLNHVEMLEMIRVAQPAEPGAEDEE